MLAFVNSREELQEKLEAGFADIAAGRVAEWNTEEIKRMGRALLAMQTELQKELPVSPEVVALLKERLAEYERDPSTALTLEQFKRRNRLP
jgi:hypothetical protein